jgi:hypothetical protein
MEKRITLKAGSDEYVHPTQGRVGVLGRLPNHQLQRATALPTHTTAGSNREGPAPETLLRGEYSHDQKAGEVRTNTRFFQERRWPRNLEECHRSPPQGLPPTEPYTQERLASAVAVLSAADIRVHGYSPPLQQPLRNVATVLVALAPAPQFFRGDAILLVQSELAGLLVECGGKSQYGHSRPWCKSGFPNRKDCVIHRDDS